MRNANVPYTQKLLLAKAMTQDIPNGNLDSMLYEVNRMSSAQYDKAYELYERDINLIFRNELSLAKATSLE